MLWHLNETGMLYNLHYVLFVLHIMCQTRQYIKIIKKAAYRRANYDNCTHI